MANRTRYLLRRIAFTVFAIYVIATALFFMFRLMPGSPVIAMVPQGASEALKADVRQQFGLDQPLYYQYVLYIKNLLMGNLGISFSHSEPVAQLVFDRTLNTLSLMLPAVLLSFTIGPLIGAMLAWHRGKSIDTYGIGLVLIFRGAPVFWVGMLAIMVFSFQLGWLPTGGMHSPTYISDSLADRFISVDFLWHLILPLCVVTLYLMSIPTFIMRNTMIDVLNEDFVELLHAEGLSDTRIMFLHAARNSLLPIIHYLALALGAIFGGSVVIETVFSWPGIGLTMFEALQSRDYPLVQGAFLMVAVTVIIMNLLADVVSVYIDPRAAEGGE